MHCPHCHREYDAPETTCVHDGAPLVAARRLSLVRAEPWPEAGTMFGERYRAIGLLGKGAVAEVLLAEDIQTGEPVAVKVLHGKLQRDRDMRTRFLREATASERIGHPNIVHILDSGERRDGTVYLVLEFLFGESFGDLLRREGKIDAELALPILHQVAEALAAAHEAGIVHRDVKPDNVYLVGAKGEPYGVKLLDFGFAKLVESGLTAVGTTLGTPPYMAPEQILTDPVGPAVDIYALGVVLYRALTGVLPFAQKNDLELLAHHLFVTPTPPRSHAPEHRPGHREGHPARAAKAPGEPLSLDARLRRGAGAAARRSAGRAVRHVAPRHARGRVRAQGSAGSHGVAPLRAPSSAGLRPNRAANTRRRSARAGVLGR
jgi:serine/threonine protein kinase